jgi:hypothetical protein
MSSLKKIDSFLTTQLDRLGWDPVDVLIFF